MDSLKLSDLRHLAKERGIVGISKMKRQQLITALSEVKLEAKPVESSEKNHPKEPEVKPVESVVTAECEGGVCPLVVPKKSVKKSAKKPTENGDPVLQEYLDAISAVPISSEITDKMTKARLADIGKQHGIASLTKMSKVELFQNILRAEIEELIKEL